MPSSNERPHTSISSAARSSRWILGTQAFRLGVRVVGTVTLARLLTPSDYGVFGMAAAVHGFGYVFQDFGLATVTLRKPELSDEEKNTLFWLNAVLGAVLAVSMIPLGFAFAAFFHERSLRLLIPAIGFTFLVNGIHTQLRSQLAREHQFATLNRIEIGSFTTSTAAAIAAAWAGAGVWALVILTVVAELGLAAGAWARQPWRPGPPTGVLSRGRLLTAGAALSANDILRFVQRNADQFLIGRWLGAGALGIYGRAVQFAAIPVVYLFDPLTGLAVSTLRHLAPKPAEAREFWRRMLGDLAWIALPAAAAFACMPREIIVVSLGARWSGAAPVLEGLAIGVASLPLLTACSWLFLASGGNSRLLAWSAGNAILVGAACALARNGGIAGVALAVGSATAIGALLGVVFMKRADAVRRADVAAALVQPLAAAAALAAALTGALWMAPAAGDLPRLSLGVLVCAAWAGLVWAAWPGAREEWRGHFLLARHRPLPNGA